MAKVPTAHTQHTHTHSLTHTHTHTYIQDALEYALWTEALTDLIDNANKPNSNNLDIKGRPSCRAVICYVHRHEETGTNVPPPPMFL